MTEVSPQILLIGAGSIGRRHLENLTALGYKNISVVTRSPLTNNFSKMPAYKTIGQALNSNSFTTAFICTPTSLHTENLKELLSAQVPNIYIEKPVSNTSDDIKKIKKLAAGYKNHIVVGFDLHFDPGLQKVQQLMQQNIIGKTVSVNAFVGQHLAQWRPYEDYRKGMSARVETGGGVLLDIIHEFDYLCWLNGPVDTVAGLHVNTGSLEIETEECAEVLLQFKNGSIGAVHLDYFQPSLNRFLIITGTHGTINCNLSNKKVQWVTTNGTPCEYEYKSFERNDRFKNILLAFMENKADYRLTNLDDAMQSLYIVEAAKQSKINGRFIPLDSLKN